jgi:pyroglutamyl-peptidase
LVSNLGYLNMLLTGFEAYGGRKANPSANIVEALDGEIIAGKRVRSVVLPVAYDGMRQRAQALIDQYSPSAIISLGLWPGESAIRLERVALNWNEFKIPDNLGLTEKGYIDAEGPPARFSTLPIEAIKRGLLDAKIPAQTSRTAGSFICNAWLYSILAVLAETKQSVPCGFIHLPYAPEQVAEFLDFGNADGSANTTSESAPASMNLSMTIEAVRIAMAVTMSSIGEI